jgi:hypothetical protein
VLAEERERLLPRPAGDEVEVCVMPIYAPHYDSPTVLILKIGQECARPSLLAAAQF